MFANRMRTHRGDLSAGMAFVLLFASGCAPLQQAPLVYTSSHVIGVKLGVAPTQPESMEAVIGYKDLDAAYAPVAVSNPHLDKAMKSGNHYDKDLYEIKEIYGIYGTQASASGASQLLTPEESADMKAYFDKASAKQSSASLAAADKAEWEKAQNLKGLADRLREEVSCKKFVDGGKLQDNFNAFYSCAPVESQPDFAQRYALLSGEARTYAVVVDDEKVAKGKYDKSLAASQAALSDFAAIDAKVKGALEKLASIQKRDAISVYGSFDADTAAETAKSNGSDPSSGDNGVSVKVGKVFSTGVAAQNVSEAQKIAASAVVVSACINAIGEQAKNIYPGDGAGDSRKTYIQELIPECLKVKESK